MFHPFNVSLKGLNTIYDPLMKLDYTYNLISKYIIDYNFDQCKKIINKHNININDMKDLLYHCEDNIQLSFLLQLGLDIFSNSTDKTLISTGNEVLYYLIMNGIHVSNTINKLDKRIKEVSLDDTYSNKITRKNLESRLNFIIHNRNIYENIINDCIKNHVIDDIIYIILSY